MESPASGSMRGPEPASPNAGVLPTEVLFDILLRLPAKELCRLRAVCRSWRALTSDPLFISAHAARHPDPLFLVNFRDDDRTHVHVVDLSGSVVKRIPIPDGHLLLPTSLEPIPDGHLMLPTSLEPIPDGHLLPTSLELACAATTWNSCHVIDPATGSVCVLPESSVAEHVGRENLRELYSSFAFGKIAATGEYKVLRMISRPTHHGLHEHYLFEVFTINSGSGSSQPQWRARPSHDEFVEQGSEVVVGEMVYFKIDYQNDIPLDHIIPFNLEKEEWGGILPGPISGIFHTDEYDDHLEDYRCIWFQTILADLRGSLALVHYRKFRHIMDLWLLKDFDDALWVKEYTIQIEPIVPATELCVNSLFMLGDGRLVIHFLETGLLLIYDPRTNTFVQVEMRHLDAVAMYTGNLLSLQARLAYPSEI